MSRLRADKLVNRTATGSPELTYGADIPVSGSLTGAGGINISGVATAFKFVGDGSGLSGVTASGTGVVVYEDTTLVGTAGTFVFGTNVNVTPVSAGVATISSVNTDTNTTYGMLSVLDGNNVRLRLAGSDSSNDDTILTAGTGISFAGVTAAGFTLESSIVGLANVVEDTTPQLGGNLDLNGKVIEGSGSINMTGGVSATIFTGAFNGPSNGLTGTPDITVGQVVGTGASFTGNVSVGGTLTYEDVTNIDVVGISTFSNDVYFQGNYSGLDADALYWDTSQNALQFQDSVKIYMGPTSTSAASTQPGPGAGLQIEGNSTYGLILGTNNVTIRSGSFSDSGKTINLEAKNSQSHLIATGDAGVEIFYSGNKKIETTNTGAVVTGILTATTLSGAISSDELTIGSSVGIATAGGVFTANAGTAVDMDSFNVSTDNRKTSEYLVHLENGNNLQAQKVLVTQNGSNAYYSEFAIMSNPNKIASFSATVVGGNCKLQATPESGISGVTTYRIFRQSIS